MSKRRALVVAALSFLAGCFLVKFLWLRSLGL